MQGTAWIGVFRRIPTTLHDCLIVMTTNGAEVILQRLIRLDRDFLVALGRLSGTTDQAKVLILPYDQMTYLSFGKKLSEEELQGAIGKPGVVVASEQPAEVAEQTGSEVEVEVEVEGQAEGPVNFPSAAATPVPVETARAEPAPPDKSNHKVVPPSKSVLLARLRERLAGEVSRTPGR
jgi:hypothetical protein